MHVPRHRDNNTSVSSRDWRGNEESIPFSMLALRFPRLLRCCAVSCLLALLVLPARSQTGAVPEPSFVTGADLSFLPHYKQKGVRYFDEGKAKADDLLKIAKRNGWTIIRVRLWVHTILWLAACRLPT
ncbi:hypothetical protein EON66_06950 [archaeon]|nr:MAG: hypothetical protein EON66_06950 [archaeon]